MLRKTSCLLALVSLCGVGQAGVSMADGADFIGHLPQGTVELVGITNYPPTKQSRWWQPDGSAAQLGSFLPQRTHFVRVFADEKALTFLVRFENLPADASWPAWGINPWASTRSTTFWNSSWEGDRVSVVDAYGNIVPNCKMFSASRGASDQTADFRVGICMGAWNTLITQKAHSAGRRIFSRDGQQWIITFQKATAGASADTTQVRLTHNVPYGKWNVRLVAVDSNGSEHATSIDYGRAVFQDLPLSSIKEFRFQVRPYYWVEFKNVSLQSGQKTDVKVVSSDDSVNTEK